MESVSNEMLFYGGLAVAGVSIILAVVYLIIYFIGKRSLNSKFDKEYGPIKKVKKNK